MLHHNTIAIDCNRVINSVINKAYIVDSIDVTTEIILTESYDKDKQQHVNTWEMREENFSFDNPQLWETLFSLANGYFGTRGTLEEGASGRYPSCEGTYLNGVYKKEKIIYGETAAGFATHNHKMIQVPNGKSIRLFVGQEEFFPREGTMDEHIRHLDMRMGTLNRHVIWATSSGKKIRLETQRFVSLANQHLMGLNYSVTPLNFAGTVRILSSLDGNYGHQGDKNDPRAGRLSLDQSLQIVDSGITQGVAYLIHNIKGGNREICSATKDVFTSPLATIISETNTPNLLTTEYDCQLRKNQSLKLVKYVVYIHGSIAEKEDLKHQALEMLAQAETKGFEDLLDQHCQKLKDFWDKSDIHISGDPLLQQGMRFNLFHIYQSVGKDGHSNIGAKGLTGPGYDGHYFWDTEIYIIPFLLFTSPDLARKLLEFRYNILPQARARARELSHNTGALYAWRTIGGEECSAYYPASTAQYHINSAIAYAINQYLEVTDDWAFIWEFGAEILFETARIWPGIGQFSERRGGQFCIYEVTGPDEYTALVDNNFYTNSMAKKHLQIAVNIAAKMAEKNPKAYQALREKISLSEQECLLWAKIAENMYLPYDEDLKINPQDDGFLDKPLWDVENTPKEKYPLLLHFHPLVIYRHRVLKQADVILAMFLLSENFSLDLKKSNLDYYEPLTTHDSTLSACIHSIECAEVGYHQQAYAFFQKTVRMDLDNHHNNTEYGLHTACMAGSWMSVVNGFAGMRILKDKLFFAPFLPDHWQGYAFSMSYRGNRVHLLVDKTHTTYELLEGSGLTILHNDQRLSLKLKQPMTVVNGAIT